MGVDFSRFIELPFDIDDPIIRSNTINFWNHDNYKNLKNIKGQFKNEPTLSTSTATVAINIMFSALNKHNISNKTILEIGSGNGVATKLMHNKLKGLSINLIATDFFDFHSTSYEIDVLNSIDAVAKYGNISDILLLLSPIPCSENINEEFNCYVGYYDYYAIRDYIEISTKNNYIIFIGELGASDGSTGLYRYLIDHDRLDLLERVMITHDVDPFFDGFFIEKEFFLFQIKV